MHDLEVEHQRCRDYGRRIEVAHVVHRHQLMIPPQVAARKLSRSHGSAGAAGAGHAGGAGGADGAAGAAGAGHVGHAGGADGAGHAGGARGAAGGAAGGADGAAGAGSKKITMCTLMQVQAKVLVGVWVVGWLGVVDEHQ